ncbi:acetyltransferase (GNAT) family protein [Keratinibaculum paraultunense]|uniref:Acetyltransferase (GNAT) family protein n=1 Tax=Keratinibaculum paraultunense TaxID=1278232 RepID=A0A4R3KRB1_9FIRM|nr:GNAT family N-acetyltransferase [Keratinibaculum paraultunense]QQY78822.1 GNAT family N-acetyltransferase [Keratinibaculum paraultunense]TCS87468.1 acetyltransferase (GNAT) family protein [Keratinibaculum paraultunense]
MELTFRNASSTDIDKIFELNKDLIEKYETNLNYDFEKIFTWVKKKIEKNIDNYQCIYFNGIKVGYFFLHTEGEILELDDLFIFEKFQGKGIGTKVLKYVDLIAKKQNKDVFLYVFISNEKAINLYQRNGYKIVKNIANSRYLMSK